MRTLKTSSAGKDSAVAGRGARARRRATTLVSAGALGLALAACGNPPVHNSAAETALAKAVRKAVLAKGSVHVVIERRQKGKSGAEVLSGDIGNKSADESVSNGSTEAAIRVTPKAAYYRGNRAGLTTLMGLTKKEAVRVGNRWVEDKAGSSGYKQLFQADTMASLPGSLLPGTSVAVDLSTSTLHGTKVKVLAWAESSGSETAHQTLYVPKDGVALPLSEKTTIGKISQVLVFSAWGERLDVAAPPAADVIPSSDVKG